MSFKDSLSGKVALAPVIKATLPDNESVLDIMKFYNFQS